MAAKVTISIIIIYNVFSPIFCYINCPSLALRLHISEEDDHIIALLLAESVEIKIFHGSSFPVVTIIVILFGDVSHKNAFILL